MKVAVVGTGISGLVVARRLAANHELTIFEADDRIGGHTHTHDVQLDGRSYAVDSGFIVFNRRNYPNFVKLLEELGVESDPSFMSFSVQCEATGLEYNGTSLNSLFVQRRNLLRPSFYRMLRDVLRFNREAMELLDSGRTLTIGEYLAEKRYSRPFIDQYLLPMGASIWSSSADFLQEFPAEPFVRFFHNHGMLTVNDRPEWRVIRGGSRSYVKRLIEPFADRIRRSCPVLGVRRDSLGVVIRSPRGEERFDEVVLATHSDQALRLLEDPSESEREILGFLPYQENEAVLHTDQRLLPRRRGAWASWNFYRPRQGASRVTITYDMNILQGIESRLPFCVTLNRTEDIDPAQILETMTYHHPAYTADGFEARRRHHEISGVRHTHYCGAYWGYGFHEDGVKSALAVVDAFQGVLQQ